METYNKNQCYAPPAVSIVL